VPSLRSGFQGRQIPSLAPAPISTQSRSESRVLCGVWYERSTKPWTAAARTLAHLSDWLPARRNMHQPAESSHASRANRKQGPASWAAKLTTGIVGLPNVGKSTLFNALLQKAAAEAANFPFCTIEPNTGIVSVPDPRLQVLAELASSEKVVAATMEFVDIAGAFTGQGLGVRV